MSSPALAKATVLALTFSSLCCNQTESAWAENEEALGELSLRFGRPAGGSEGFCRQYDKKKVRIKVGNNPASPNQTYLRSTQNDQRFAPLFPIVHEPYHEADTGFHPFEWRANCTTVGGYEYVIFSNVDNSVSNPKMKIREDGDRFSLYGTEGCPDFLIVQLKDAADSDREYSILGYSLDLDEWGPLGAERAARRGPFNGIGELSLFYNHDTEDYSTTFEFEIVS